MTRLILFVVTLIFTGTATAQYSGSVNLSELTDFGEPFDTLEAFPLIDTYAGNEQYIIFQKNG